MSRMMLHGLGDCTPENNCGCLTNQATTIEGLKQRLEVEEFFPYQLEFFAGVQADTSPRVRGVA